MRRAVLLLAALAGCARAPAVPPGPVGLELPGERHLRNVRQLTFGGQNAEAYFSPDGKLLVFQSARDGRECDQEYVMDTDGEGVRMVSTGKGQVTCGYFFPDGRRLLYASTMASADGCAPRPDRSQGYVWPLLDYQIYAANADGTDPRPLSPAPGYNAEATISGDGWIVFTSTRDGDLDLYKMRLDGSELTRLTRTPGYDGGAFFSPDGRTIVFRASRPQGEAELAEYRDLLRRKLVRPGKLEIMLMDADGSHERQVTRLGAASFAPFFFPDGRRVIFSSNAGDPGGRNFALWMVNVDGSGLEQVTFGGSFDGFPMFSPDGRRLVFASNRNGSRPRETNVFIADWVE